MHIQLVKGALALAFGRDRSRRLNLDGPRARAAGSVARERGAGRATPMPPRVKRSRPSSPAATRAELERHFGREDPEFLEICTRQGASITRARDIKIARLRRQAASRAADLHDAGARRRMHERRRAIRAAREAGASPQRSVALAARAHPLTLSTAAMWSEHDRLMEAEGLTSAQAWGRLSQAVPDLVASVGPRPAVWRSFPSAIDARDAFMREGLTRIEAWSKVAAEHEDLYEQFVAEAA